MGLRERGFAPFSRPEERKKYFLSLVAEKGFALFSPFIGRPKEGLRPSFGWPSATLRLLRLKIKTFRLRLED
jgi:hypothetical protein